MEYDSDTDMSGHIHPSQLSECFSYDAHDLGSHPLPSYTSQYLSYDDQDLGSHALQSDLSSWSNTDSIRVIDATSTEQYKMSIEKKHKYEDISESDVSVEEDDELLFIALDDKYDRVERKQETSIIQDKSSDNVSLKKRNKMMTLSPERRKCNFNVPNHDLLNANSAFLSDQVQSFDEEADREEKIALSNNTFTNDMKIYNGKDSQYVISSFDKEESRNERKERVHLTKTEAIDTKVVSSMIKPDHNELKLDTVQVESSLSTVTTLSKHVHFLDTVLRMTGKVGTSLGKKVVQIARNNVEVTIVAKQVHEKVERKFDKLTSFAEIERSLTKTGGYSFLTLTETPQIILQRSYMFYKKNIGVPLYTLHKYRKVGLRLLFHKIGAKSFCSYPHHNSIFPLGGKLNLCEKYTNHR